MPRLVDHAQRRTQLADALMRLAAREGLLQVSLRHVAAEGGVSMGLVQHYFATKDEMFRFAIETVAARVEARLAEAAGRLGAAPASRASAEMLLREMLPLDEERRVEGHVGLAYLAYSAHRPELSAPQREQTAQLRAYLAEGVRRSRGDGPPSPEVTAVGLLGLVEGLSMHVLTGHLTAADAEMALDAQLDAAFSARP